MSKPEKEWVVPLPADLMATLLAALDQDDKPVFRYLVGVPFGGAKAEIFAREHPPPHFRATYDGRSGNFAIDTGLPVGPTQLPPRHCRRIRKWHAAHRNKLIEVWNSRRPSDCPVGPIKPGNRAKKS